jgi:thiol:disulfide interchange protein
LALVCNIDQRGRSVRYRIGFVFLALAVAVYVVGSRLTDGSVPALIGGVLAVAGLFSLFEANRGWCGLRALGFKTKV